MNFDQARSLTQQDLHSRRPPFAGHALCNTRGRELGRAVPKVPTEDLTRKRHIYLDRTNHQIPISTNSLSKNKCIKGYFNFI